MIDKLLLLIVILILLAPCSKAQTMDMDACMAYAVEHSTMVGKQTNVLDDAVWEYNKSIAALFPTVSAGVAGAINFGRSIDPETNNYTTVSTFGNSYSLQSGMPIFSGMRYINAIRAAKAAQLKGQHDLVVCKTEVAIATMTAYIEAVYYQGAIKIAQEQLANATTLLTKTQKLYELGRKSAADVAELEAQKANYEYMLVEQENNMEMAVIKLRNIMNYPQDMELTITTDTNIALAYNMPTADSVTAYAMEHNSKISSAELYTQHSKLQYKQARGSYIPTIYLYGGYNTSYFTNFENPLAYNPFWLQVKNNQGGYIQLNLSIPIFSNLDRKTQVVKARNAWHNAQLDEQETRNQLTAEITTAVQQMRGLAKQYYSATQKLEAAKLAYEGIATKYEKGIATFADLQTAATTVLQAELDCLHTKLKYGMECRMVDYYSGIPLIRK